MHHVSVVREGPFGNIPLSQPHSLKLKISTRSIKDEQKLSFSSAQVLCKVVHFYIMQRNSHNGIRPPTIWSSLAWVKSSIHLPCKLVPFLASVKWPFRQRMLPEIPSSLQSPRCLRSPVHEQRRVIGRSGASDHDIPLISVVFEGPLLKIQKTLQVLLGFQFMFGREALELVGHKDSQPSLCNYKTFTLLLFIYELNLLTGELLPCNQQSKSKCVIILKQPSNYLCVSATDQWVFIPREGVEPEQQYKQSNLCFLDGENERGSFGRRCPLPQRYVVISKM